MLPAACWHDTVSMFRGGPRAALVVMSLSFVSVAFPATVSAQNLKGPQEKQVVFETKYQFYVSHYTQAIVFDPSTYQLAELSLTASTDELAVQALVERARGNFNAYVEYMSVEYREAFLKDLEVKAVSPGEVAERWRSEWLGMSIQLIAHIYRSTDEIIRYRVLDPKSNEQRDSGGLAFRRDTRGLWKLVYQSDDVVFKNWDFDGREKVFHKIR